MGRRVSHPSEYEAWRAGYERDLLAKYGDPAFVSLVLEEIDDDFASFGGDPAESTTVAEARAFVRRRLAEGR